MDKNKFDIHARNLLDDHESLVNTDALWDNVRTELYPRKKKKFAWVWFSASSILAVLFFSGYVYLSTGTSSKLTSTITKSNEAITTTNNNIETESIAAESKSTLTKISATEAISKKAKKETIASKDKLIKQRATKKEVKSNARKATRNKITKNNKSKNLQSEQYNNTKSIKNINQVTPIKNVKELQEFKTNGPQKNEAKNLKTKTDGQQESEAPIETKSETPNDNPIDDETKAKIIAAEESKDENLEEPALDESEEDDDDNESFNRKFKRNFQLGVGFRVGISNSLTTLSANGDADEIVQLRTLRSQSEKNLETIDLGLDVLLKHKSGVYLSTGLDYLRATRKLEFNQESFDYDSIAGISAIYVNPITMDSSFEEGIILQTTSFTRKKEVYNYIHVVNIPVHLGVDFDYQQWTFGVQGGASLNVFLRQKGQIMDGENSFYDLGEDDSDWFKDNLGITFQGAALIGYNFSDNFQIVGGPSFRSPIIISEDINPIKQSQVGLGLQVNARYWFD